MRARVTITLPEPMLDRLDSIAAAEGLTRSDVVREAASNYLSQRDRQSSLSARGAAVHEDLAWLEQVARQIPCTAPHSLELLHEVRAEAGGAGKPLSHSVPARDERR
jgi:predicted transcriptional regulator